MKLLRCRKCGATITTNDEVMRNYMEEIDRLTRLAIKDRKNGPFYQMQAASLKKIVTQIMHLTAQNDEKMRIVTNELAFLNDYVREHHLVPDEKLWELRDAARERARKRIAEDEKKIEELYGNFNSILGNRSRRDPTENKALRGYAP